MTPTVAQTFATHRRYVPLYHFYLAALLLALLVWKIVMVVRQFSWDGVADVLLVVAVVLAAYFARAFPAANQDRIIRLEERLRLERLLPDALRSRVPEFTSAQLVGLRFASDAELPALAQRVLDENIRSREAIKQLVTSWRADDHRI